MRKICNIIFLIIYIAIVLSIPAQASKESGTLKAKIIDAEGFPLPGAFVYLSSKSLIGFHTYITTDTGLVRFKSLPPGHYTIMVEMPGFKTVSIEDIIISVGKTVNFTITLEMSTVEEEITKKAISPTLDIESAKNSSTIDNNIIRHIPFPRDLSFLIKGGPGIVTRSDLYSEYFSTHGASVRTNSFFQDGFNITDPVDGTPVIPLDIDVTEEIELETGAHPAENTADDGGYINIVTRIGSNSYSGEALVYFTDKGLSQSLIGNDEIGDRYTSIPNIDKRLIDSSFLLSGPILKDIIWFFGNIGFTHQSQETSFVPWSDPMGITQENFDWNNRTWQGFLKLNGTFTPKIRASASFSFSNRYQGTNESPAAFKIAEEATRVLDHDKNLMATGIMRYTFNQNSFVDIKAGYLHRKIPLYLNENGLENPQYIDTLTEYQWGSASLNEHSEHKRFQVGVHFTHFQDSFIWGNHEFKAGAEYEFNFSEFATWKYDNLLVEYFNSSPYYYGITNSPETGNNVGKGRIRFYLASLLPEGLIASDDIRRLGAYIENSATFGRRLTLYLGLRFDRSYARQLSINKSASGNTLSQTIGEEMIEPDIGINPFGDYYVPEWNNLLIWNSLSPRAGLTLDISGNGKTLIKASYASYPEYLRIYHTNQLNPIFPLNSHRFFWYDENMDGLVDIDDTFELYPDDYRIYDRSVYINRIDPDLSPPAVNELIIGIHQELFKDFSLRINYIRKKKDNIMKTVPYSYDDDKEWYWLEDDTEGWWVPFSTTIPGVDEYPNTNVTVYFPSIYAPDRFDRLTNVPQLVQQYSAWEFILNKRMSHNWQLFASLVYSKARGNTGLGFASSSVYPGIAFSPNYFTNRTKDSLLDFDRPFVLKVLGTYRFPLGISASLFYSYMSGTPWIRSVTIVPPSEWAAENNVFPEEALILLEDSETNRFDPIHNVDFRIEKDFNIGGSAKLGAFIDIYNLLGTKYQILAPNDGGYWFPDKEDSAEGTRLLSPDYQNTIYCQGARIFKFCIRFSF
ncbi:MAG: TonB-dependent receptor [Candidatus Aminicenantes bacterium]|nr:TonB-dependent receptor [Candidatus Aminicenantes bacterium]